jgi:hypothetical protein
MNQPDRALKVAPRPGPSVAAFEKLDFDPDEFDHEAHVYVAWQYLQDFDLLEAIQRYRLTLKRLTAKLGIPGKFHETITWFFMICIAECCATKDAADWAEFRQANPQLFLRNPGIVSHYYSGERLNSELAQRTFLLPDLPG